MREAYSKKTNNYLTLIAAISPTLQTVDLLNYKLINNTPLDIGDDKKE